MDLKAIKTDMERTLSQLAGMVNLEGRIMVLGGSTSEIKGEQIGTAGDEEVARAVLDTVLEGAPTHGFHLAVQCCEHLNRALVVEDSLRRRLNLPAASVVPTVSAGGALAARAAVLYREPVVVEAISGSVGLDVGHTLIGMHLEPVVVPLRLDVKRIGRACLLAAASRPRLIGGERASYPDRRWRGVMC